MKKKEFLALPERTEIDHLYKYVYIIPAGTKHDSGWMRIAVIGMWEEDGKTKHEICGYPDDINWIIPEPKYSGMGYMRTDCLYPQGVLKFWGHGKFRVEYPASSQNIEFIPNP